jgi:hypothetical protein
LGFKTLCILDTNPLSDAVNIIQNKDMTTECRWSLDYQIGKEDQRGASKNVGFR